MSHRKNANRTTKKPQSAEQVQILTPEEIQILLNWDMNGVPHYSAAELMYGWEMDCDTAAKKNGSV